jgi:hypothetical protein
MIQEHLRSPNAVNASVPMSLSLSRDYPAGGMAHGCPLHGRIVDRKARLLTRTGSIGRRKTRTPPRRW